VANEVWMLENAMYSVISPEGCASILWKDSKKVKDAAECLKLTADDLKELNVIEELIAEPKKDFMPLYNYLQSELWKKIRKYQEISGEAIAQKRYERFRSFGVYNENM